VPLLVPVAVSVLIQGAAVSSGWGVRALHARWAVFVSQVTAVVVGIPITIILTARWGALGAAWGLTLQVFVLSVVSWWCIAIALRRKRHAPE
jgi:O-antigen/teichoic acid export membrane protein